MSTKSSARKVRNADSNPCIQVFPSTDRTVTHSVYRDITVSCTRTMPQESDGSQKCLEAYNYDKSMCSAYFMEYKNCRKYWHTVMLQRRREGIKPDMPTAREREEMLASLGGKPY